MNLIESNLRIDTALKFQRLLVPVDFTAASRNAFLYAGFIAERFGSTRQLLHVVETHSFAITDGAFILMKSDEESARHATEQLSRLATEQLSLELPIKLLVRRGQPVLENMGDGYWVKALSLSPGNYEYRLIVAGEWIPDPLAEHYVRNPFGGINSVLTISLHARRRNWPYECDALLSDKQSVSRQSAETSSK